MWAIPVSAEEREKARRGEWDVLLTLATYVPDEWFPPLEGRFCADRRIREDFDHNPDVLCKAMVDAGIAAYWATRALKV